MDRNGDINMNSCLAYVDTNWLHINIFNICVYMQFGSHTSNT